MPQETSQTKLSLGWKVLHWAIIVNFLSNIIYGSYQLFFILRPPDGSVGPLWGAARTIDPQLMMIRRAYATEVWLSIVGVCLYIAITEFLPRLLATHLTLHRHTPQDQS